MCGLALLSLLVGVLLTLDSYVRGPKLAYETQPALWFGAILITIVASWGHRKSTEYGGRTRLRWSGIAPTAPRWSLVVLGITAAHLVVMGGWKILGFHRVRLEDLEPDVVLASQSIAVHIQAWGVVIAWSALRAHWSQVDLDEDFDLD
jgi:hypothetical protein